MEIKIDIHPIGIVHHENGTFCIKLKKEFIPALTNIEDFSHLQVIWWGHLYASEERLLSLIDEKPYKKGPGKIGVFATRSPVRPNPVLITNIFVQDIDFDKGIIYTPFIDAEHGTPVIDIKPYHKSERVKDCAVPDWCSHWPEWDEDTADFDWEKEFNF
ncbi:MAG: SAM-dependent methyltransferase [Calditrichaceae bacterium]|nr:SAM-dependent methyltransferase [Calditrichaceae bacterium]MBN2710742.1 SAM-dependent methyltransferase [Calditrichaceae bacterium]RQV95694.1 MAG: S-adenosylmethionine-dependent methyltransferase [Calditrichota bacterium]